MEMFFILPFGFMANILLKKSHRFSFTENLYIFAFIVGNANLFAIAIFPVTRYVSAIFAEKLISIPITIFYTCIFYKKGNFILTFLKTILQIIASYLLATLAFLLIVHITSL